MLFLLMTNLITQSVAVSASSTRTDADQDLEFWFRAGLTESQIVSSPVYPGVQLVKRPVEDPPSDMEDTICDETNKNICLPPQNNGDDNEVLAETTTISADEIKEAEFVATTTPPTKDPNQELDKKIEEEKKEKEVEFKEKVENNIIVIDSKDEFKYTNEILGFLRNQSNNFIDYIKTTDQYKYMVNKIPPNTFYITKVLTILISFITWSVLLLIAILTHILNFVFWIIYGIFSTIGGMFSPTDYDLNKVANIIHNSFFELANYSKKALKSYLQKFINWLG